MCFATLALAAGGLGAATTGVGAIEGGAATSNAAKYSAQVAANNATIANQNAAYAIASGQQKAATQSLKGAATMGNLKAAQAASGVDVNSGTALDVQTSEREISKLDTDTVLNNAQLEAYGYRTQATNYEAQSKLDEMEAEQAALGGDLSGAGSFLGGLSSVGLKWAQLGK